MNNKQKNSKAMNMNPTTLIYSSHDRGDYLHRQWIVNRALQSEGNKTILYLPFSMTAKNDQEYSWGTFKWYFDQFASFGLEAHTAFWTPDMTKEEAQRILDMVRDDEVVILGGGATFPGFEHYDSLGILTNNDYTLFKEILHQRQAEGKLTVGFSAGAMQLADVCHDDDFHHAYSLVHNVVTQLHHEWGQEAALMDIARRYPSCFAFGLPNDSAIASNQGYLASGNKWQILQFIIDNSWDKPEDKFHMKSRMGMPIEHYYTDGRKWDFKGGDVMVRIFSPDYMYQGAWIFPSNSPNGYEYWSQQPTQYKNADEVLAAF